MINTKKQQNFLSKPPKNCVYFAVCGRLPENNGIKSKRRKFRECAKYTSN